MNKKIVELLYRSFDDELSQAEQQQLDQLRVFYADYLAQFERLAQTGLSVSQLLDFRVFLNNLEEAIGQSEQQIALSGEKLQAQRDEWVEKKTYADSLIDFEKRLQRQGVLERSRQNQKEIDDRPRSDKPV